MTHSDLCLCFVCCSSSQEKAIRMVTSMLRRRLQEKHSTHTNPWGQGVVDDCRYAVCSEDIKFVRLLEPTPEPVS